MDNKMNDNVNDILDMLKKKAESEMNEQTAEPQTTEHIARTEDELKEMLKKQFEIKSSDTFKSDEDYSFDITDFHRTGEITAIEENDVVTENVSVENVDVLSDVQTNVDTYQTVETVEKIENVDTVETVEVDETVETETASFDEEVTVSNKGSVIEEIVDEVISETEEIIENTVEEINDGVFDQQITVEDNANEESTMIFSTVQNNDSNDESNMETSVIQAVGDKASDDSFDVAPQKYEQLTLEIDYSEVAEGQQGTVFNSFVEDFSSDLDDVVFEAEITESKEPEKQFTIFEDWEKMMQEKQYNTVEEGIIPPTKEELAHSAEIAARVKENGYTDYFSPVVTPEHDVDAVDIALMVALGGENELNQTVGFEKIRQAVNEDDSDEGSSANLKSVYGCLGEEYTSAAQNSKIKKKYRSDKTKTLIKAVATGIITLLLFIYEIVGWRGIELGGILNAERHPGFHVIAGLQLLVVAIILSGGKLKQFFKNMLEFSSISYIGAITVSILSIIHDILILTVGYAAPGETVHSLGALLLLISLVYDIFDVDQQSGVFDMISNAQKKIMFEPYGKLRMSEDEVTGDVLDKDSYCITKVSSVSKFFSRMAKPYQNVTGKLISLVLSFSVSLSVMLVLVLMGEEIGTIVLSLIVTLSFSLICASIFESEFAFYLVYRILEKYRTGIIGKTSVAEYGKCNIVYFDDFNVFNKKSVRTKGLKLYDNNEIYRILYHTQAVFSKVGGPLKGVFEFATSEMTHSKNVEIREVNKEGISALVDGRTVVLIGTGSFMRSKGIHPSYTSADLKLEESGEESIMFISLNGTLGAKLYVTYQFSSEFERLARKLTSCGIGIGVRSFDPNINDKWAKKYGNIKNFSISAVRPTLKEIKKTERALDGGIVSSKNVRALAEALMMCVKLDAFDSFISKLRIAAVILVGALSFALVIFSGVNAVSMLLLLLVCAFGASVMMLLSYFYVKR